MKPPDQSVRIAALCAATVIIAACASSSSGSSSNMSVDADGFARRRQRDGQRRRVARRRRRRSAIRPTRAVASPDPRIGLKAGAGVGGRRRRRVEHAPPLELARDRRLHRPRRDRLRPRVHGQVRDSGQLSRLPDLGHLEPEPRRRSSSASSARRARATRRCTATCSSSPARRNGSRNDCGTTNITDTVSMDRFRGIRVVDIADIAHPKRRHEHPDVPWLAHEHARQRSARQGQHLHLRLRLLAGALVDGAAGLP